MVTIFCIAFFILSLLGLLEFYREKGDWYVGTCVFVGNLVLLTYFLFNRQ